MTSMFGSIKDQRTTRWCYHRRRIWWFILSEYRWLFKTRMGSNGRRIYSRKWRRSHYERRTNRYFVLPKSLHGKRCIYRKYRTWTCKKIDESLHQEQVDKHVQLVLHNLPLQTQNVFELYTKHHLTIAEIAEVSNISITDIKKLLDDARKLLKASLLNRYTIY